jgi:ribose/xylose/arabinose/galactoside ABC-type transport system permease subunit
MVLEIAAFSQGPLGFFGGGAGLLQQFQQFAPYGFCALGLGMVILTGGIDLSVGAVASLTGVVMALIWSHGVSIWVAAFIALGMAAAIGALIGVIVVTGGLDPWIVTLAMMFMLQSVAQVVVGTPKPYLFPDAFIQIGQGAIWNLPYSFLGFVVLALVAGHIVGFMPFGRKLIMIGSNKQAARYAGIRRGRVIITVHALGSLCAGMAGVVMSSMFASARADLGQNLMMPALTAIVLGGVDIFGGYGRIRGIVLGVLTIGFLQQGLMLYGVNAVNVQLIVGAVLLVAASGKNGWARVASWLRPSRDRSRRRRRPAPVGDQSHPPARAR